MNQKEFAHRACKILEEDTSVIGLAVGGSWLRNEMDEYSDLDLVLVTREKVSTNKDLMIEYANRMGNLLSAFTGEHVGEPRLLICLYDNPLLHVDIKFLTIEEVGARIETPHLLLDRHEEVSKQFRNSEAKYPSPDYQWIEDRFWIWVHYVVLKLGRGEYLEAFDFFGYLRMIVFGPFLQIKNGKIPRGVRKVEVELLPEDMEKLKLTIPEYNRNSLFLCLINSINLYRDLRKELFGKEVYIHSRTEEKVTAYLHKIESSM